MYRILIVLALFWPASSLAWGQYGHETIARIAMVQIKPVVRRRVMALLRYGDEAGTPECRLRTVEDASVWPDCVRNLKDRFGYTAPWHYQNADVCRPFDLTPACRDGNCVSAQIERQAKLLARRDLPARERVIALAFLIHFVGDLHMPLHAGDRGDRGGNDLKSSYGIVTGQRINMHGIWDGWLAERAITTPPAGVKGLLSETPRSRQAAMAAGSVSDWSRESWQIAHDSVYESALNGDACAPEPKSAPFGETQIEASIPVVRLQIERAGLRLARLLNAALN